MEFYKNEELKIFENNGFESKQIINPENSNSQRLTITHVTVEPGSKNMRHKHNTSEQIWYAIRGKGKLLLKDNVEKEFTAGDVARFEDGDIHGFYNDSNEVFEYIAVTSPPINFRKAYKSVRGEN